VVDPLPLIGVTGPARRGGVAWTCTRRALDRAGARAVRLTPASPSADAPLDGLVLGGGTDVDPRLYGAVELGPGADPARDELELTALARAAARELPVLGICRGAQLLNVWAGGTLDPRIRRGTNRPPRRQLLPILEVRVEPGSVLASALGRTALRVNTLHHQAVASPGAGLRVVARDRFGIPQAVEDPRRPFRLGVQWHPELLPRSGPQVRLFRALVAAARNRRERRRAPAAG
jgi:putative glutamine amidotransferase